MEDHDSRAGKVCGVELAKLADRVDQVARDKVRPSLVVRSHAVPDPDRPGWGCLLVHVPPSAQAPHMVDYIYYGRGDRANVRLGDEQVRAILEARQRGRLDVATELLRMVDDDPISGIERQLGHLYVLAQPEIAAEEMLVELLGCADVMAVMQERIRQRWAAPARGGLQAPPGLGRGTPGRSQQHDRVGIQHGRGHFRPLLARLGYESPAYMGRRRGFGRGR